VALRHVQIESVAGGTLVGEKGRKTKKPFVRFKGIEKPLALNATNAKTIAAIVGSNDTERWIGQWLTLYPSTTQDPNGATVDCIRIRPKAPTPPVPAATPAPKPTVAAPKPAVQP
jgi:hypothetical protein